MDTIKVVFFSQYSFDELKRISTISIKNERDVFSSKLGTGSDVYCSLCVDPRVCPGHLGYVELHFPIIHPLYGNQIINVLNSFCHFCYRPLGLDLHFRLNLKEDIFEIFSKLQFCTFCKSFSMKYCLNASKNTIQLKNDSSTIFDIKLVKDIFSKISDEDLLSLGFEKGSHPRNFILEAIPVTPNCVRMRGDFISKTYSKIIQINKKIYLKEDNAARYNLSLKIHREYTFLLGVGVNKDVNRSLKDIISGKSGIFRKFSLGKRNKYCGRSVISPDPNLGVDVVGIPKSFVKNMPFKVDGEIKRYIQDGDFILLNRQPSLKSSSIMAFRVKIMDNCLTIVLNPAVCPAFNADFDGDEMNVFFPTNYVSKIEAVELLGVEKCIISPHDDKPVIYPIQDSVVGLYMLTSDETFVSLETFCDCLVCCWEKRNVDYSAKLSKFERSTQIISGKVLFSHILPDISYKSDDIEIKSGILIKGQVNTISLKAIIKKIVEQNGNSEALCFIDNVQTLVIRWMMEEGLSIGYDDCYIEDVTDSQDIEKIVIKYMESFNNIDEIYINIQLNNIRNISQKRSLEVVEKEYRKNRKNGILEIVKSGAKGSITNFAQIISLVGQQNVGGKRPEKKISNNTRTLPHFVPGDNSPQALGFCFSSYTKGLSPTEYFLHCQGAREGLIDTAIKTAEVGYINRKFVKATEDLVMNYDGTVRYGNNIVQL